MNDDPVMDRRTVLALSAVLPALATPAAACSVALTSPRRAGMESGRVRKLFEVWWQRDADAFRGMFTERLMDDGTPMDRKLAQELLDADPIPVQTFAIFERFFADAQKDKRLSLLVNTAAGVVVGCSEAAPNFEIGPDCSGMPEFHLFLVTMNGLNPRSVSHIATTDSVEPSKVSIWTEA